MKRTEKESLFEDLKQGLEEAIAFNQGKGKARVHRRKVDVAPLPHYQGTKVKHLRERLNLSQRTFAEVVGVSLKTIEAWEANRSEPNGPAQRVLSLIDKEEKSLEKLELIKIS